MGKKSRPVRFNFIQDFYLGVVLVLIACATWYPWKALADQYHQNADTYWSQAKDLYEQGWYLEAAKLYEKSIEAEQISPQPRMVNLANELGMAGYCYKQVEQYEKALEYYEQALKINQGLDRGVNITINLQHIGEIYYIWGQYAEALTSFEQALEFDRKLGQEAGIAFRLNNIGLVYSAWGQYDKALDSYQQALELARKSDQEANVAIALSNIGEVYRVWGQYNNALDSYQQALELERKAGLEVDMAIELNNIGLVYYAWGQYDKALEYYQQALELERKLGQKAYISTNLNDIGLVYYAWGQYDKALEYYQQALELARKFDQEADIATALNNIGEVYRVWGQYNNALESYQQALELVQRSGREVDMAIELNNIGLVYEDWGQYSKALNYYQQALELVQRSGREADVATVLHNTGTMYYDQQQCTEAIPYFVDAVELLEQIRKTATGDVRRDYFSKEIHTYQLLTVCYLRVGDLSKAFQIIELSRAKLLEERLAGSATDVSIPSLEVIQQSLPDDTAVLLYANTTDENMVQMLITKEHFIASERPINQFVQKMITADQTDTVLSSDSRGLEIEQKNTQQDRAAPDEKPSLDFKTLIKHYRIQLVDQSFSRGCNLPEQDISIRQEKSEDVVSQNLNTHLYAFLFGNIQEHLQGKTRLLILPDGMLNFLPFETLVDEQGHYLVETCQIAYAQSLGVLEVIGQREYDPDRKPLLAFGGAVYEEQTYQEEMADHETQFVYIQRQIDLALKRGHSLRAIYAQLGRGNWENLPGTLVEVKAIQDVMAGTELVTGADVNEAAVKALSANGELANYKVLHFATHGAVDSYIPELSALVLSLMEKPTPNPSQEGNEEDGYLRAGEIVELDIRADFVNLSACETGLGKLYSGEGVVGLTQAFLLAGANGLSVSLWSVADESTAQFMVALYTLVEEEGLGYAEAITEVKRRFIRGDFGDALTAPYFWAPFVYYGK